MTAKRPVQSPHLLRPMPRSTAIAGKPAPTFDRVQTLEYRLMWERACPRRGRCNHHLFWPMPPSTAIAGKPAATFDRVPTLELQANVGAGLPAKRPVQSLHLFRPMPPSTPIAGKPAPTFDRVPTLEYWLMWERACPRRGRCSHCTYSGQCHVLPLSQASPLPPLTEFQLWNTG